MSKILTYLGAGLLGGALAAGILILAGGGSLLGATGGSASGPIHWQKEHFREGFFAGVSRKFDVGNDGELNLNGLVTIVSSGDLANATSTAFAVVNPHSATSTAEIKLYAISATSTIELNAGTSTSQYIGNTSAGATALNVTSSLIDGVSVGADAQADLLSGIPGTDYSIGSQTLDSLGGATSFPIVFAGPSDYVGLVASSTGLGATAVFGTGDVGSVLKGSYIIRWVK